MRMQWSIIFGLIFALLIALFAVINVDPVQVNFGFSIVSLPLILVILSCALIGGLIVGLYGIFRQYKQQRKIKSLTAELTQAQEKIATLEAASTVSAVPESVYPEGTSTFN
ncbi:DUF1049 domain-containing protein [Paenibacillus sp. 7124]|uniref:DUF1049 domain-containing protein n=2 Tax=Paenibacillus TaxID=44249 RepID=A0A6M1PMP6_9BACL|nr:MULTISPECIES: lipopolysaccharide assembly protein LapA domain-containing protein [Paenibacillus]AHV96864.1 hypothetical protein PSAB_09660 [Paenibacillus sabinae T27]NGM84530.1 DUF1049 domain-containing protein [Paenibacillus apii]NJJ40351.1 DUF1049 domain-containing protein [Paenibacillus apii]